jgi:hypothetical protein
MTMSIVHSQLQQMKQQLLTITDGPGAGAGSASASFDYGPHEIDSWPASMPLPTPHRTHPPPGVLHASEQAILRMFRPMRETAGTAVKSKPPSTPALHKVSFSPESIMYTPASAPPHFFGSDATPTPNPYGGAGYGAYGTYPGTYGADSRNGSFQSSANTSVMDSLGLGEGYTDPAGYSDGYWRSKYQGPLGGSLDANTSGVMR